MPLSFEQKVNAFEKWCRQGRRKNSPRGYTDDEIFRKAGQYRTMAAWGDEISQEEFAFALRERFKQRSRKAILERAAARKRAAAKRSAKLHAQLKKETEEPSLF